MTEFESNREHVNRILRCQSHYEVLGISRHASNKVIKAAYKKLALIVHPDRNDAPKAKEAFQAIQKASADLLDPRKRVLYDLLLNLRNVQHQQNANNAAESEADNNDGDDANEKFDRHSLPKHHKWQETKFGQYLLLFMPVISFILLAIFLIMFQQHSIFSFTSNANHVIRKRTIAGKIPYYVTRSFDEALTKYYGGSIVGFERDVKNAYKIKLIDACKHEKIYKQEEVRAAFLASNWKNRIERVNRAKSIETPSCSKLEMLADVFNDLRNSYLQKLWRFLQFLVSFFI